MIKNHFPTCWVSGSYAFEQQRESKLIHFPTCWFSGSYAFEQQRESKLIHSPTCWASASYSFEQQRESKLIHFPTSGGSDSYACEQQRESQQCTPVMKISIKRMITINNNSNSLFNKLKETKLAFSFEALSIESWNQAYEAINFMFNQVTFKSRLSKKTPKKDEYFFTILCINDDIIKVPLYFYS